MKIKKQSSEWYTFCKGDYEHYLKYIFVHCKYRLGDGVVHCKYRLGVGVPT